MTQRSRTSSQKPHKTGKAPRKPATAAHASKPKPASAGASMMHSQSRPSSPDRAPKKSHAKLPGKKPTPKVSTAKSHKPNANTGTRSASAPKSTAAHDHMKVARRAGRHQPAVIHRMPDPEPVNLEVVSPLPEELLKPTQAISPTAEEGTLCRLRLPLHVMSDSTGNLAQHMLTAFLTQFPENAFTLHRHNFLQTVQALHQSMEQVTRAGGLVMHAFVSPRYKQITQDACRAAGMPCCDLTGPFVDFLSEQSGVKPVPNLRRLHDTTTQYHQRIKALEFTLEHDDGLGLETLHNADVVLAGVSRTSKTPTSIYLAQQGYNVANVSLAMEVAPPPALLAMPRHKVVGLIINSSQLVEIRTNRQVSWRMGDTRYNDVDHVAHELVWCRQLFGRQGWHVLDVTDQAVEETAGRIIDMLQVRRPPGGSAAE